MYQGKTFLAIIPARGGSKRLPGKNTLPLAKKPLITWTIEAALESSYIDMAIVSSDEQEILDLAKESGAVSLVRPSHLATDEASTLDALNHVIDSVEREYDYIVLLQATSPLRTTRHINEAIELLIDKNADSIVSLSEANHNPLWTNVLPEDGCMKGFLRDDVIGKRSQDLDTYYQLNGAIYIVDAGKFKSFNSLLFDKSYAYIMPQEASIDIDTMYDYICAEAIIKHNLLSGE